MMVYCQTTFKKNSVFHPNKYAGLAKQLGVAVFLNGIETSILDFIFASSRRTPTRSTSTKNASKQTQFSQMSV